MKPKTNDHGFSLIELLVVTSVASIMTIGLTMFVGSGFKVSRQNFEQLRITEDIRHNVERMSMAIKNARPCNGQDWLQNMSGNDALQIYTNIDDEPDPERVTYERNGNNLISTIDELDASCNEVSSRSTTLATTIRNGTMGVPVFQYYDSYAENAIPVSLSPDIRLISIKLVVDVDTTQYPNATTVETKVGPHFMIGGGDVAVVVTPSAIPSVIPSSSPLPTSSPSSSIIPSPSADPTTTPSSTPNPTPTASPTTSPSPASCICVNDPAIARTYNPINSGQLFQGPGYTGKYCNLTGLPGDNRYYNESIPINGAPGSYYPYLQVTFDDRTVPVYIHHVYNAPTGPFAAYPFIDCMGWGTLPLPSLSDALNICQWYVVPAFTDMYLDNDISLNLCSSSDPTPTLPWAHEVCPTTIGVPPSNELAAQVTQSPTSTTAWVGREKTGNCGTIWWHWQAPRDGNARAWVNELLTDRNVSVFVFSRNASGQVTQIASKRYRQGPVDFTAISGMDYLVGVISTGEINFSIGYPP